MADNIRSIPSVADGLKPGQRKVLYACFKRNLNKEIKVAQLGGYVSEKTAYHHGEQSLYMTIVGLAQNFVGSNNINLLEPNGQFGTRIQVSLFSPSTVAQCSYNRAVKMLLALVTFSPTSHGSLGASSTQLTMLCSTRSGKTEPRSSPSTTCPSCPWSWSTELKALELVSAC